jgi:uncharacterized lipoprotein YbaY
MKKIMTIAMLSLLVASLFACAPKKSAESDVTAVTANVAVTENVTVTSSSTVTSNM